MARSLMRALRSLYPLSLLALSLLTPTHASRASQKLKIALTTISKSETPVDFINASEWGHVVISQGKGNTYNVEHDVKILPGLVQQGFWGGFGEGKTSSGGKGHTIGMADIKEFLNAKDKLDVVIFGIGQRGVLKVLPDAESALKEAGLTVLQDKDPEAAAMFNENVQAGKRVGALIHSNC